MNAHLDNFLQALVFGDECEIDTTKLYADAETIVAEFLISCAPAIENYDAQPIDEDADDFQMFCEGCAAFNLATFILFGDELGRFNNWPTLKAYAEKMKAKYL